MTVDEKDGIETGRVFRREDGSRLEVFPHGDPGRPGRPNEITYYPDGSIHHEAWTDEDGEFSRADGPATIAYAEDGKTVVQYQWVHRGSLHREDGPAILDADGSTHYYVRNHEHREDGPASDHPSGSTRPRIFYLRGMKHTAVDFLRATGRAIPAQEHVKAVNRGAERGEIDLVKYAEALAGGAPHEWAWSFATASES